MRGYGSRRVNTRQPSNTIIVVCEGKTEITYLESFKTRYNGLQIVPMQGKCTDPIGIVQFAIEQFKKNARGLDYKNGDRVWCVFDVDSNSNEALKIAFTKAAKEGIEISLSNPCIELWFLLHCVPQNAALSRKDALRELIRQIPDYQKGEPIADKIKIKEPNAITQAKALNKQHDRSEYCINTRECNPSSQMFVLIEYIYKIQKRNEAESEK